MIRVTSLREGRTAVSFIHGIALSAGPLPQGGGVRCGFVDACARRRRGMNPEELPRSRRPPEHLGGQCLCLRTATRHRWEHHRRSSQRSAMGQVPAYTTTGPRAVLCTEHQLLDRRKSAMCAPYSHITETMTSFSTSSTTLRRRPSGNEAHNCLSPFAGSIVTSAFPRQYST